MKNKNLNINNFNMNKIFEANKNDLAGLSKKVMDLAEKSGFRLNSHLQYYSYYSEVIFEKSEKGMPTLTITVNNEDNSLSLSTSSSNDFQISDFIKNIQLFEKQVIELLTSL